MLQFAFVVCALLTLVPVVTSPVALGAGLTFGLLFANPFPKQSAKAAKMLLQIAVVGLGFSVPLLEVWKATSSGFFIALGTIAGTLALGLFLARILKVSAKVGTLISFGTAICGGSAIAALAPVLKASSDEIAISLAVVFTLNAVALFLFPALGHALHFNPTQFGLWAALAIHDTSSVVGAASAFSPASLPIATTIKRSRAIWILPFVALFAWRSASQAKSNGAQNEQSQSAKAPFPWFIVYFLAAASVRTFLGAQFPQSLYMFGILATSARQVLCLVLFLIGAAVNRDAIRNAGWAPFAQAVVLWICVSVTTAFGISFLGWS